MSFSLRTVGRGFPGGGDTIAAIDKCGAREGLSYLSTGGGAFLAFVEGKTLPAIEVLEARAR